MLQWEKLLNHCDQGKITFVKPLLLPFQSKTNVLWDQAIFGKLVSRDYFGMNFSWNGASDSQSAQSPIVLKSIMFKFKINGAPKKRSQAYTNAAEKYS